MGPLDSPSETVREATERIERQARIERRAGELYADIMRDEARLRDMQMLRDNPVPRGYNVDNNTYNGIPQEQLATAGGVGRPPLDIHNRADPWGYRPNPAVLSPNEIDRLRNASYDLDISADWGVQAQEESGILENGPLNVNERDLRASHKMDKFFSNSVSCPECENTFLIGDGDIELICPGCKFEFTAPKRGLDAVSPGGAQEHSQEGMISRMDNIVWEGAVSGGGSGMQVSRTGAVNTASTTSTTASYPLYYARAQTANMLSDRPITATEIMINEQNHGH